MFVVLCSKFAFLGKFAPTLWVATGVRGGQLFLVGVKGTLISLINVEVRINVEGVQKMQNH